MIKLPGIRQFMMEGFDYEAFETLEPGQTRIETLRLIEADLDLLAKEWKERYEKKMGWHSTPVSPPRTVPAGASMGPPVATDTKPEAPKGAQPTYEGDAFPNVHWKDAPYGQSILLDLERNAEDTKVVSMVVEMLDKRKGTPGTVVKQGFLGLNWNGLDVFGSGQGLIIGAHRYNLGVGQMARFLNRQLAKPKEAPK